MTKIIHNTAGCHDPREPPNKFFWPNRSRKLTTAFLLAMEFVTTAIQIHGWIPEADRRSWPRGRRPVHGTGEGHCVTPRRRQQRVMARGDGNASRGGGARRQRPVLDGGDNNKQRQHPVVNGGRNCARPRTYLGGMRRRPGFISTGSKSGARFAARRAGWEDFAGESGLFRAAALAIPAESWGRFGEEDSEVVF
jgi:hypothetical protein